jgi:hypothetical protein
VHPKLANDPSEELAHGGGELAVVGGVTDPVSVVARRNRRDHTGRSKTNAEQPALALGNHLELDRRLVQARLELLELAQRRPLRLADGLAGGLDLQPRAFVHHRGSFCDAGRFLKARFLGRNRARSVVTAALASCA